MHDTIATTTVRPKDASFEAMQWDGSQERAEEITDWITATDLNAVTRIERVQAPPHPAVTTHIDVTSNGATMRVESGDWVLLSSDGFFRTVWKGDFAEFYETA